jgi:hypothetical protein
VLGDIDDEGPVQAVRQQQRLVLEVQLADDGAVDALEAVGLVFMISSSTSVASRLSPGRRPACGGR